MNSNVAKMRFLLFANLTIIVIVLLWFLGTNLLAKKSRSDAQTYLEQMSKKFPKREPNSAAKKLQNLATELDIELEWVSSDDERFIITNQEMTALSTLSRVNDFKIWEELPTTPYEYIQKFINFSGDTIPKIPPKLKKNLNRNRETLDEIRNYLTQAEKIDWGTSYDLANISNKKQLSVLIGKFDLQNLLLVEAIEQNMAGNPKITLANLKAVAKLNQSLVEVSQWTAHREFSDSQLPSVIRKLNNLPENWQDELKVIKNKQYIINSFKVEAAIQAKNWSNVTYESFLNYDDIDDFVHYNLFFEPDAQSPPKQNSLIAYWLFLFQKPYSHLKAFAFWPIGNDAIEQLKNKNFCKFELYDPQFDEKKAKVEWWPLSFDANLEFMYLFRSQLEWELTEKVQQIKVLAREKGEYPDSIEGIETSICEESRWNYTVNPDGTASIQLQGVPPEFSDDENQPPFEYHLTQPPKEPKKTD